MGSISNPVTCASVCGMCVCVGWWREHSVGVDPTHETRWEDLGVGLWQPHALSCSIAMQHHWEGMPSWCDCW